MEENRITYFGETDARNRKVKFGIKAKDRTRHVYVIGKTGMGKSTLLENMAVQDIQGGEGTCFIDPHGKTADLLLEYVPKERIKDVIHIAPFDIDYPISFNVLESVDAEKRHLVVSGLMSTFKKIWEDAWSARMEYILTNTLLALLEAEGSTLLGVNRMLSDKEYRKEIVNQIKDPSVKNFWVKEFANYTERMAAEAVPAIQNKVGQFTANPLIRNMIGQPHSSFDFREAMDKRKIIIINLSKGRIGDENMKLLGGLLVTKIYLAAMSRADIPDRTMKVMPNFYLFVDEFQNFANASFADILSEARKYKLNLTIAHQYIEQMDEIVRPAVFGNVGTMIAFRVGATDAEVLEKEFAPVFTLEDLVNLGFAQIYLKLMIDGLSSTPFSAVTLPPIPHPDTSYVKEIIDSSRQLYARARPIVEEEIVKFHDFQPAGAKKLDTKNSDAAPRNFSGGSFGASSSGSSATNNKPTQGPSTQSVHKPFSGLAEKIKAVQEGIAKPVVQETPKPIAPEVKQNVVAEAKPNIQAQQQKPQVTPSSEPSKDASKPEITSQPRVTPQIAQQPVKPKSSEQKSFTHISAAPKAPENKPVPLSSLASKDKRVNPKSQSPKNVNDLKNALAAVMQKSSTEKKPAEGPKKEIPATPIIQKSEIKPDSNKKEDFSEVPREVPEDVLKNVLKVE